MSRQARSWPGGAVLSSLPQLNHDRCAEEAAQGLHERGKAKGKGAGRKPKPDPSGGLFGKGNY